MSDEQHRELLEVLTTLKGKFLLSGYHSLMYDTFALHHGWKCYEKEIANHAAGGGTKRRMIECLWSNF